MPYLGVAPNPRENREVDDISSGFNGGTTQFTLQSGGSNVSPGKDTAIIVSLGGVIQNPGTDYTIAASTITFTTAPASGLSFFGVVLAQSIDIETVADNTVTTAKIVDGAITNAKVNASAAIASSKLAKPIDFADNEKARFGSSQDLEIFHDGTRNLIDSKGTQLRIESDALRLRSDSGETYLEADANGAVQVYHDNSKKFFTVSNGVQATNRIIVGESTNQRGLISGDQNGVTVGAISNIPVTFVVNSTAKCKIDGNDFQILNDSGKLEVGASQDFAISHNGTNSVLDNQTGHLMTMIPAAKGFRVQKQGGQEDILNAYADGAVQLYNDSNQRLATTSNGFDLKHSTGDVNLHFNRFIVNAGQTFFIDHTATGADFQIRTSDSSGLDTTAIQILASGCLYNRCRSSSQASFTLRKQESAANNIDYLQTRNDANNLRHALKGDGGISNIQGNDTNLSDETMKKNIVDCESVIDKFKQWKLRKFNYNTDENGTPLTYGLIAQEIETLHSDLVNADFPVDESGEVIMKKTVKDHQLMMLSFKALQEAIAKIETLETKVAALEAA